MAASSSVREYERDMIRRWVSVQFKLTAYSVMGIITNFLQEAAMNSQNSNPFVLPGFGQAGDYSQNPLLASMEMMRQAWQGLATSGVLAQPPVSPALTTEDLDRRISDLRAVENWLRLN